MTEAKSLLLLDADPGIRDEIGSGLRHHGYQVGIAASVEEAYSQAGSMVFDLAVLDVRLPGISGAEVAEWLQKHWDIPALFMSAADDQPTVDRAIQAGGLGFLVKPVTLAGLIPAVEAALARSRDFKRIAAQSAHLEKALAASRLVSVAVGITMVTLGKTQAEAFEHLRQQARRRRKRIEFIAEEVLRTQPERSGEEGDGK